MQVYISKCKILADVCNSCTSYEAESVENYVDIDKQQPMVLRTSIISLMHLSPKV